MLEWRKEFMKNNWLRKGLEVGTIILLVGTSNLSAFTRNSSIDSKILEQGKTFYVGGNGPGNYTYIQGAINDANDGDTVFVYDDSSPYKSFVSIDKSINLIGEDKNTTILDSTAVGVNLAIYSVDKVNISGFTLYNSNNHGFIGIQIYESDYTCFRDNIIIKVGTGIDLVDSYYSLIENNEIKGGDIGIDIYGSSSNNISKNILLNNNYGVWLNCYSKNNTLCNNNLSNNGIAVWEGSYPNTFYNNAINGKPLLYLENESNKIYDGVSIGQFLLINCNNIIFRNLEISNSTYGIELYNNDDCSILNCTFRSNKDSGILLMDDCDNNNILNNIISANGNGISLISYNLGTTDNNNIIGNSIILNKYQGIDFINANQNTISNNIICKNGYRYQNSGITLATSIYNKIIKNYIEDNYNGITLFNCVSNIISENNIANSSEIGVYIDNSIRNIIKFNNIVNNKDAGFVQYSFLRNVWRRNYWDAWNKVGPKIIWGERMIVTGHDRWGQPIYSPIPWFNIDWQPAKNPYVIGG